MTTLLQIDFTSLDMEMDIDKEIQMLGNGLARSCNALADSSKKNHDKWQIALQNEMAKGLDADLSAASESANKASYFEAQQIKWIKMRQRIEAEGYSDTKAGTNARELTREQLEELANARSK